MRPKGLVRLAERIRSGACMIRLEYLAVACATKAPAWDDFSVMHETSFTDRHSYTLELYFFQCSFPTSQLLHDP